MALNQTPKACGIFFGWVGIVDGKVCAEQPCLPEADPYGNAPRVEIFCSKREIQKRFQEYKRVVLSLRSQIA